MINPPPGVKWYYSDEKAGIYILHGDCRDFLPHLPKVDLVLTDPPYGIGKLMKGGKDTGHWNHLSSGNQWDMEAPDVTPLLTAEKRVIIWGGNYFDLPPSRCWFAWVKSNSVPTQADMELAWTNIDEPARCFEAPTGGSYVREHPTQKPLALISWCIGFAPEAQTILDPFMGSGTTLRAALDLGRKAIGIEIEERYCRIAVERLRQTVLPLQVSNSHDIIKEKQEELFHGASTNGRNKKKDFQSKQGAENDAGATAAAE